MLKILSVAAALVIAAVLPAAAQKTVPDYVDGCVFNSAAPSLNDKQVVPFQCTSDGKLQVNAAVSASIAGFSPGGSYTNLTATNASADAALPTGTVVIAYNTGTTAVSCNLTIGAGTAVANKDQIQASSWIAWTVGTNTHVSCIDQTGSASNLVVFSGGSGIPTGAGGGGGSSSGGTATYNGALPNTGAQGIAASTAAGVAVPLLRDASGAIAVNVANGVTQSGGWSFTCISGCSGATGTAQVNVNNGVTQSGNWNVGQSGPWQVQIAPTTTAGALPVNVIGGVALANVTTMATLPVNVNNGVSQSGNWSITASPAGAWGVTQSGTWTMTPNGTLGSANPGNGFVAGAVAGNGTLVPLNRDSVGALAVNVASGVTGSISCSNCSGTTPTTGLNNADSSAPVGTGLVPVQNFEYGYNPATAKWDRFRLDTSDNLMVNGGVTPGNFTLSGNVLASPALSVAVTGQNAVQAGSAGQLIVPAVTTAGGTFASIMPTNYGGVGGYFGGFPGPATTTSATYVRGGPTVLMGGSAFATGTTSGWLKIYDSTSTAACPGAANLKGNFAIPVQSSSAPNTNGPLASGFFLPLPPSGIQFTSGIVICLTGSADPTVNLAIGSTTNFINLYMQ